MNFAKLFAPTILFALASGYAVAQQSTVPPQPGAYAPPQLPPRNETPEARRARWEAWHAANADIDVRIAAFLHDTEAQIAAYRARPSADRFAALHVGMTPTRRRDALVYFGNALAVWRAGDFPAAEIGFRRGLEIDPTNAAANFYMGDILRRRNDNDGARERFERSVAFGAGSAEALRAEAALAQMPAAGPDSAINEPPVIWDAPSRPSLLWDGPDAPEMVVIPAGTYTMGSPLSEAQRDEDEGPQHRVTLFRPFAVSRFEITRGEYTAFVQATGRTIANDCYTDLNRNGNAAVEHRSSWRDPSYPQVDDHPIVCSSWDDAQAYVRWLSQSTGKTYRLLSESEWEYAARASSVTPYFWGRDADDGCRYGNVADARLHAISSAYHVLSCDDGAAFTTVVGSYPPNAFGLYDMIGNAAEWVQDCYANGGSNPWLGHGSYVGAPTNGAAASGDCSVHMSLGGSWLDDPQRYRSAFRAIGEGRYFTYGFRVARTL